MKRLLVVCAALLLVGCSEATKTDMRQKKEAVDDAVDTVIIQRGKMEAGREAGQKVREISAERDKDLRDAMGE